MTDDDLFNGAPVPVIAAPAPSPSLVAQSLLPPPPAPSPGAAPSANNTGMAANNPLNLRPLSKGSWPGQVSANGGFAQFDNPADGWNAADQNLQAKVTKHGLNTIQGIIGDSVNGWAPAADNNDPASYAAKVAGALGVKPTDDVSQRLLTDSVFRHNMLEQMAQVETGAPQSFGAGAGAAPPAGLTPEQQQIWETLQTPEAQTPGGNTPSSGKFFTVGDKQLPVTQAQETRLKQIASTEGWNPNGAVGFDGPPYPLVPGGNLPAAPGARYVDLDGHDHYVPGSWYSGMVPAAFQGLVADPAATLNRLTQGGATWGGGDPMMGALAQSQGGPSALQNYQNTSQGVRQEQNQYQLKYGASPASQATHFVAQALPATALAAAVPELEAPAALGRGGELLAQAGTNALRGVAGVTPSIGANLDQSVASQLGQGAAAGVLAPPLLKAAGIAGSGILGPSLAKVAPEVQDLADRAINQYGIPLRASQIAGTADPSLAVKDSNLINAPGSGFAANHRQQLQAITRAVGSTFGADTDQLTPEVMTQARQNLGNQYDQFAATHSAPDVTQLHSDLDRTLSEAKQVLPASEVSPLENQVQNIKDLTTQNGGTLPGNTFQALTRTGSPLDRAMESKDSNIRYYAGQIHDALTNSVMQSATPEEQQAFSNLNLQYKNLMTVRGLAAKADIQGAIPVKQLPSIVNRNFDRAFNDGGPLGDIADVVSTFMPNIPNSFTGQRAAEIAGRNWLPSALGGLAGASEFGMHDPGTAMKLAAAAGVTKGAQYGVNALEGLRLGANAGKNLVGSPGPVANALSGVGKSIEVPLSAMLGARTQLPNASALSGVYTGTTVGANAQ